MNTLTLSEYENWLWANIKVPRININSVESRNLNFNFTVSLDNLKIHIKNYYSYIKSTVLKTNKPITFSKMKENLEITNIDEIDQRASLFQKYLPKELPKIS